MDKIKILFGDRKKLILLMIGGGIFIAVAGIMLIFDPFRVLRGGFFDSGKPEAAIVETSAVPSAEPSQDPVREVSILFLGDLMFDRNIRLAAQKNGNDFIFAKLSKFLAGNDLAVANLEGPITDNRSISIGSLPGSGNNFIFTFSPDLAPALFDNNIRLVNLGNNHILNFGQEGLEATKRYLNGAGIKYFGAPGGERGFIEEIGGVKIGFVNYNQFAGKESLEADAAVEELKRVKSQADIAVLYAHWGIEYAADARDALKNLGRRFIDAGADLVIGSHAHVIQPAEEYNSKRIYYSLGNFVFDQYFNEAVRKGLAVIVKINSRDKSLKFEEKNIYLQTNGQTAIIE